MENNENILNQNELKKVTLTYEKLKPTALTLQNDTLLFCNTYEMMKSCIDGIPLVQGWAKTVLFHDARKNLDDLYYMAVTNYAVQKTILLK